MQAPASTCSSCVGITDSSTNLSRGVISSLLLAKTTSTRQRSWLKYDAYTASRGTRGDLNRHSEPHECVS